MEDSKGKLDSILQMLDDAGMTWLTEEARQLYFGRNEPSVSPEEIAQSRQAYDAKGGEAPFKAIESLPSRQMAESVTSRDCIEFIAARIDAIAGQLQQAELDAVEIGIQRIQLGLDAGNGDGLENAVELLRSLAESVRAGMLQ